MYQAFGLYGLGRIEVEVKSRKSHLNFPLVCGFTFYTFKFSLVETRSQLCLCFFWAIFIVLREMTYN